MTTGAPPPNLVFRSSAQIVPSFAVQTRMYNEAGFIPHPLEAFGRGGGISSRDAAIIAAPKAGVTGNAPGMPASNAAPNVIYAPTGRENGMNY